MTESQITKVADGHGAAGDGGTVAPGPVGPVPAPAPGPARPGAGPRAWWWALGAAALALLTAYAPNLLDLTETWKEPDYSHGWLVVPIAAYIFWQRLAAAPWKRSRDEAPAPAGWALLIAALALRSLAYEKGWHSVETATLPLAVAGLIWTFGGWPLLRRAWPAVAFLVFMLPLPQSINELVALPLQRIAATGSRLLLQATGMWVVQDGNALGLSTPRGMHPIDVARVCSGLRMLMTLAATVTAMVMLVPMPRWKQVVVLLSGVPIALISNIFRIAGTAWFYYYVEGESAQKWAHDAEDYIMMPMALVLVGLELWALSWLAPEDEEDEEVIVPLLTVGRPRTPAPGRPPAISD